MNPYIVVGLAILVLYALNKKKSTAQTQSQITPGITNGIDTPGDMPPSTVENNTVSTNIYPPASIISSLPTPGSGSSSGGNNPVAPLDSMDVVQKSRGATWKCVSPTGSLAYEIPPNYGLHQSLSEQGWTCTQL